MAGSYAKRRAEIRAIDELPLQDRRHLRPENPPGTGGQPCHDNLAGLFGRGKTLGK